RAHLPKTDSCERIRIVGKHLSVIDKNALSQIGHRAQDSSIRLWGEKGQKKLAQLRIGLIGAGGVGSILAEHLARLGIGGLIIVDYDTLKEDNFNRSSGAKRINYSSKKKKAMLALRIARASSTCPTFVAEAINGSIVEQDTLN